MVVVLRVHRPHHAHVINDRSQVGQDLGHLDPRLAVAAELSGRRHQLVGVPLLERLDADRLAGHPGQGWLRVEEVHLARPTVLDEHDHRLGPGREMRPARTHVRRSAGARLRRGRALRIHHVGEGKAAEAQPRSGEQLTTGDRPRGPLVRREAHGPYLRGCKGTRWC